MNSVNCRRASLRDLFLQRRSAFLMTMELNLGSTILAGRQIDGHRILVIARSRSRGDDQPRWQSAQLASSVCIRGCRFERGNDCGAGNRAMFVRIHDRCGQRHLILEPVGVHQDAHEVQRIAVSHLRCWIIDQQLHFSGFQQRPIFWQQLHAYQLANRPGLIQRVDRVFERRDSCAIQTYLKMRVKNRRLEIVNKQLNERRADFCRQPANGQPDGLRPGILALLAGLIGRKHFAIGQNPAVAIAGVIAVMHEVAQGLGRINGGAKHDAVGSVRLAWAGVPRKGVRWRRIS